VREGAVLLLDGNGRELVLFDNAETDAGIGLDLLLKIFGEGFVALRGDHGEGVDLEAAQSFALLVDAQAQTAPDGLAAFALGADFAQRANLEHVGIIPALFQRGVGEDELELRIEAKQLLLVLHDEVVGAFGAIAIGLIVLGGVSTSLVPVDGEIAVVDFLGIGGEVQFLEQAGIFRELGGAAIFFLEDRRVFALHRIPVPVVGTIVLHGVDKEQAEHLDPKRRKAALLLKVLCDRAADHQPPDRVAIHVADGLAHGKEGFGPGSFHFQKRVAARDADFADAAILVDVAARRVLQVVAVLHGDFLAANLPAPLHVDFDLCGHSAALVAGGEET